MFKKVIFYILLQISLCLQAQITSVNINNKGIYDFIDEMANEKIFSLNSLVEPFSRETIYESLIAIEKSKTFLNKRQLKDLENYLDYYKFGNMPSYLPLRAKGNLFKRNKYLSSSLNHFSLFYSDSSFSFSLRPILGINYSSNSSGNYMHTYRGLEMFASLGKHLSLYADLRDNTVNKTLVRPSYFINESGGIYKSDIPNGSSDFSEMRGGLMLSWDFLEVGVVKDQVIWGHNNHGAIIYSGHTPTFPMIKLHIHPSRWLDFNYFHGWLVSDVVDSSLTYILPDGSHRDTYKNKYLAANIFTIIPIKGLNFSFGNSIIYSDQNINPAYLIPFLFYKSVDHTLTSYKTVNQNSQMFIDLSLRLIKHTHFYFTVLWDEFSTRRLSDPQIHNLYSYKIGSKISNWPFRNLTFSGEYYRSVPIVYKHIVPTLTYESNSYNMGYYLRDNSEDFYFSINFRPWSRFQARYYYLKAQHGNEFNYESGYTVDSYPILKDITWSNVSHSVMCSYEFLTNCYLTLEYLASNVKGHNVDGQTAQYYLDKFTPEFYQGKKNTFMVKVNFGF